MDFSYSIITKIFKYLSDPKEKAEAECTLFPSLESLSIKDVPKLKGLWRGVQFADRSSNTRLWQTSFPRLSELIINCHDPFGWGGSEADFKVAVSRVDYLKIILEDHEVESLAELGDVFKNCSSLRSLALWSCNNLSRLSEGLEHLATLESLEIKHGEKLKWEEGDEYNGMHWNHLHHNLRSLELFRIPNLSNLPKGMQHLTSLQSLIIHCCWNLEEIPEWISCLSSLQSLEVTSCEKLKSVPEAMRNMRYLTRFQILRCSDELKARCRKPDGEDWPYIKHIPNCCIR